MKITIYLSKQGFDQKPEKAAGMIKTINSYDLVNIQPEDLYNKLANGHFMHHECGYSPSSNGSKCNTFKKQLLKQAQVMSIDCDYKLFEINKKGVKVDKHYEPNEMPDWNVELLSNLKYTNASGQEIDISPTFWMESFSAHKNTETKKCGNNIHLFYVFEDPIYSLHDYEKVCISIIYAIYNALKVKGYDIPLDSKRCPFDPVSTDMFQGMWGSCNKKHHYNGNTYFWDDFRAAYKPEFKSFIFQVKDEVAVAATDEEIQRTITAYSTVKSIDDIDISKSQYIKYKQYFGHEEGFHIMSVLKHEYSKIEEGVNNKQSLCYQVCKKLLLGHCNDFFDENETTFYHEYRRCKAYKKKGSSEAAYMSHVIKLIGDTGAIPLIEYKEAEQEAGNTIHLDNNEYISDKKDDILKLMKDDQINFLIAAPGLGKTVFAKSLEGNTLIIELFNSIIQSEDKFPKADFNKFYGNNYISANKISKTNVCSANKFISWYDSDNKYTYYDKFYVGQDCIFDNVILDESHLLCLSNYRYDIMGNTVKYIKKLKNEYPNTKIIIMTGTPFGEDAVFDNLNTIYIEAEPRYEKNFHMIQTTSIEGYMKELIKDTLNKGLRVFIPVDSENWFDTFIDSCVEDGIITKDKCYYFNQPKNNEEIEQNILNTKLIGDIKILGTSSYMSVGIDLEDWKTLFITIIPNGASSSGNFSGIEVEQFANRHRKQKLEVYYVISMNESNTVMPTLGYSCRALLNIKNDILKSMYRVNPIVIPIPQYMTKNESDILEVNEDMLNVFIYYKDMKPIISHPMHIYEYMKKIGWTCDWSCVEHAERGINPKEHKELEKINGVREFKTLIDKWYECSYPTIKVKDSIQNEFEMIVNQNKSSLFDVDSIEVGFTNYYAKNTLFQMFLHLREYLTGQGTYNLINDAYDSKLKINMSFINRNLKAIKIINNYVKTGLWNDISEKLGAFYNNYSDVENGIISDNKKEFELERDNIIQGIWNSLVENIDDELLRQALDVNYNNITDNIVDGFLEGIKLICTMYLDKKTIQKKINKKNTKVTIYKWSENLVTSKYEIRQDKR